MNPTIINEAIRADGCKDYKCSFFDFAANVDRAEATDAVVVRCRELGIKPMIGHWFFNPSNELLEVQVCHK